MPTFEDLFVGAVDRILAKLPPGAGNTLSIREKPNGNCDTHDRDIADLLPILPELFQRPGGVTACHPCLIAIRAAIVAKRGG